MMHFCFFLFFFLFFSIIAKQTKSPLGVAQEAVQVVLS